MAVVQRARPEPTPENPRAVAGNNRPPIDVEAKAAFDEAIDAKDGFRARVASLVAAADRAFATDDESVGNCGELVKQIRAAKTFIDNAHTTAKAPYLLAGRAVDAAKNGMVMPLDAAKLKVEAKQNTYLREQDAIRQAEARRAREAEEARMRAEREAAAQEAAAGREARGEGDVLDQVAEHYRQHPEPERQIIRGDYGAAVSGQRVWLAQVEDYEVAFIAVANNEKVREAIDKAISAMVRGGVREIPGVRVWSDVKASNR